jgi:hypothetical protein
VAPAAYITSDGFEFYTELGIALKDHLLPFDLAEHVVFDDDDRDVELVFDQCGNLSHEHGETSVADPQTTWRPGYATAAPML